MMELTPVAWLQARITHARMNGITYFRLRSDSLAPPARAEDFPFSASAFASISISSRSAWPSSRERRSALWASSFLPRRNSQRGDSATTRLPITKSNITDKLKFFARYSYLHTTETTSDYTGTGSVMRYFQGSTRNALNASGDLVWTINPSTVFDAHTAYNAINDSFDSPSTYLGSAGLAGVWPRSEAGRV